MNESDKLDQREIIAYIVIAQLEVDILENLEYRRVRVRGVEVDVCSCSIKARGVPGHVDLGAGIQGLPSCR